MEKRLVREEPPVGMESAAISFAKMCERDGYGGCVDLIVSGGTPDYMNAGGVVYQYIEGNWFVLREVR